MSDISQLRAIQPISMPSIVPKAIGNEPELVWLSLSDLVINDAYQRSLGRASLAMIRKAVANFSWGRVKALSCVLLPDGKYEVIDGQHTAIAAASHGGIQKLPCLVTRDKTLEARAADFVGLNKDRVFMSTQAVFFAQLAAGDEIAQEVMDGVSRAGGRVLKVSPGSGRYKAGDVMCIGALKKLANDGGPAYVRRAVEIGIRAKLAPIKAAMLGALHHLVWYDRRIEDDAIVDVLRLYGQDKLILRGRELRAEMSGTHAQTLAEVIVRLA